MHTSDARDKLRSIVKLTDWSNVQIASGADGCAAYSIDGGRQVDGLYMHTRIA